MVGNEGLKERPGACLEGERRGNVCIKIDRGWGMLLLDCLPGRSAANNV